MNRQPISHRTIARNTRFQHNPTLGACWIWLGHTHRDGHPIVSNSGCSARQDVYERIIGRRPGGNLIPRCGVQLCVNPRHMRGHD